MTLLWALLWSLLPEVALLSGPDECAFSESSTSPVLESLQCHNDYESRVLCKWRKQRNESLQLWFATDNGRELCSPYDAADAAEERNDHCIFETEALAIGITHTAFFNAGTRGLCAASRETSLSLRRHLKALPPVSLSTHDAGDGARRLCWRSPYPTSSSLNRNLTYQLGYKTQGQDSWTTQDVTDTRVKLERSLLLPGRRYEARVRARASVGQWSVWSPVTTWHTEQDVGQTPTLHCVLHGEKEVMCSWEVRGELAHFITYHLDCQSKQTAPCCENLTVSSEHGGAMLRYSCLLTDSENQLLSLRPMRSAKTFKAHEHIRPKPPRDVKIREKENNWIVEWTKPSTASELNLAYQVCYHRKHEQGSPVLLNISEGSTSLTILGASLVPSQEYKVMVRSLIDPGAASSYRGIPSEWTEPVDWTSSEESWSYAIFIQVVYGLLLVMVFLTLCCVIPACQRKLLLWVDSVPSPRKSKIICEIKSATSRTLMQSGENSPISKVLRLDSLSAGSCDVLLWPTKDGDNKGRDEGCRNRNNQPSSAVEVNGPDTSSISYSGPYIFFESPDQVLRSMEVKSQDKATSRPPPVNFSLYGEGYVWLPQCITSVSTQDLTTHGHDRTNPRSLPGDADDQPGPASTLHSAAQSDLSEPIGEDRPPQCTPGPFVPWPQGGTVQPSGYCHLPTAFMAPAE